MRRFGGDVAVVFRQEWIERLSEADARRSLLISVVAAVLFFGVVIPLAAGPWWAHQLGTILVWSWMPMFLVTDLAVDAFAGERERNTLETLLVSSLSSRAILMGKLLAVLAYAWLLLLICLATGTLAVSLVFDPPPLLRSVDGILAVGTTTFLVALFTAAAGIAISMRARSPRHGRQILGLLLFAMFLTVAALTARLAAAGTVALLLAAVDGCLLLWLTASFRRSRLLTG